MQFCSSCGTAISSQAAFCPSCGLQTGSQNASGNVTNNPLQNMQKGVTKSLQDKAQQLMQQATDEQLQNTIRQTESIKEKAAAPVAAQNPRVKQQAIQEQKSTRGRHISFWFWIYLALNAVLACYWYRIDEVALIALLSGVSAGIVLIRSNKPRPFNWLVKLLLLAQIGIGVLLQIRWLDYILQFRLSQIIAALLLVNLILLFAGNRKNKTI